MDSLYDAFVSGLQSTKDNAQMDYDRMAKGGMPWGILGALQQGLAMWGAPTGVSMPATPALKYLKYDYDPELNMKVLTDIIKVPSYTPGVATGKALADGAMGSRPQSIAELFTSMYPKTQAVMRNGQVTGK